MLVNRMAEQRGSARRVDDTEVDVVGKEDK